MKKYFMFLSLLLLIFLVACGNDSKEDGQSKEKALLTEEQFNTMLTNPDEYKNHQVKFYGKVFTEPEKNGDELAFQVFTNPEKGEGNIIVYADATKVQVKTDDIVEVIGKFIGGFTGENALGGEVTAAKIEATKVKQSDYMTAFSPAEKTVKIDQESDQHGVTIYVEKLEFAKNETRLYVTVKNNSNETASFNDYSAKIIQGNQQYETDSSLSYDEYESVSSEILQGVETSGVLVFQPLQEKTGDVTIYLEAENENYDLEFDPYTFNVPLN